MNRSRFAIMSLISLALVAVVVGTRFRAAKEASAPAVFAASDQVERVKREEEGIRAQMENIAAKNALTTGSLKGRIIDQATGRPLYGASVVTGYLGASSDKDGMFSIDTLDPGISTVAASRADMISATQSVEIMVGKTANVTFTLGKAPPPCCRLEGKWRITLTIDRGTPTIANTKNVSGTVRFRSASWALFFGRKDPDAFVNEEFGDYDVDLRPFFGEAFAGSSSSSRMPSRGWGWIDMMTEASGSVRSGDEVEINFIPQLSHGGLALDGKIGKDGVIRGRWLKLAFAPTHGGAFVMSKI
ncbi:carboxypeptidase regulatory-like domain-containing protein [Massilia sp. CF038]|uniref:carboxypeptidase regulatory-like domain-containing protein n=1 Tax=Massilia sp. CF038 TaxID=1881045 RepID=UPI000922E30A|nr:carboxypeptidase regulatory-like domain-containing protein [Massilia sp. CF038]SHH63762.1 Carboxypeptidase regulatory-like domain-containing protein [Massilia sp. CF038]